jgi:aminoglycoside phosphotransferase
MRSLSSSPHRGHISRVDHEEVLTNGLLPHDDVLPAAAHLAGPEAAALLRTALGAVGGELRTARTAHVQYRPESDVVVRFEATVSWSGAEPVGETLMASTTRHGPPDGTLSVVADADGRELAVGVWRWPFDPALPGLADMVTPASAAARLGLAGRVELDVVAFRPTERAVVKVTASDGTVRYVKVLRPADIGAVIDRHHRLGAAGVRVPRILAADESAGWLAMEEISGDTLRVRIKAGHLPWPPPAEYRRLLDDLREVPLPGARSVPTRTRHAIGHAAMLATVLPDQRARVDRLCAALEPAADRAAWRSGATVHGDLYEAQLIVDDQSITGLIDVDDAGPGDPIDDLASMLGHLRYREMTVRDATLRRHLGGYADALRREFRSIVEDLGDDPVELDVVTAAVLVGLATGPFRIQQHGWRHEVRRILGAAERMLVPNVRSMREISGVVHRDATTRCEN